jgi:Asp-tRNA(Asn)/Glu-tRNA(Gln) amidotransferase A subunit family amidase
VLADHHIDSIAWPTAQLRSPLRDETGVGQHRLLAFHTNTAVAVQDGPPALSIPSAFSDAGLPVGLEPIREPLAASETLRCARVGEQARRQRKAAAP